MSDGIRATVAFSDPGNCPLAASAETATGVIEQVSTSPGLPGTSGSVTEFLASGDPPDRDDVEPVFSYGSATVFRTVHRGTADCPCELLGEYGCPVHRYLAEDGRLTLVFHARDFESLQAVVGALQAEFPPVDVQRLLRPPLEGSPEDRVFVNRGKLTDRQLEVLTRAYEMGYFERPKGANATEVAAELGIAQSTLTEHLVTAQRKLLGDILE